MNLWRRLKNLWRLSAYKPNATNDITSDASFIPSYSLKKDFPTIQKKLATIIQDEEDDFLK